MRAVRQAGRAGPRGPGASRVGKRRPQRPGLVVAYAQLWPSPARRFPLPALRWMAENRTPVAAVTLRSGPFAAELSELVEVRHMPDLSPWTPAGLAERMLRRGGLARAGEGLRAARVAPRARWLGGARALHLNSPQAVAVLRYLPARWAGRVTAYCHPDDLRVRDLALVDRDLLLARAQHFLTATSDVAEELTGEHGVAAERVTVVAAPPTPTGGAVPGESADAERIRLGIPRDAWVVAVPAVPNWADTPDLTLGLAWELARRAGRRPVHVLWFGVPCDFRRRWPIEHEIADMRLDNVHLDGAPTASHPYAWADAAVLPSVPGGVGGIDDVTEAEAWGAPALCWSDHRAAGEVGAWTGGVAPALDVDAMADLVLGTLQAGGREQPVAHARSAQRAAEAQDLLALLGAPPAATAALGAGW